MQLHSALEGYWLSKRRDFSPHTIQDYENVFKRLGEFLGEAEFEAIKTEDLERFLDHLDDKGLSAKTQQNYWAALSSLWTWAAKTLKVPHPIRGLIDRPRCRRQSPEPYEEYQVRAMIDACESMAAWDSANGRHVQANRPTALRDKAIVLVLVDTGIRISELCALRLADFERKRGQLVIKHGKGDKKRMVFLGEAARTAVWRYLTERKKLQPDDFLFASTKTGLGLERGNLMHLIQRLGKRAGVDGAGPHRFRHTFAINYLRNGGNLLSLQAMLGHEKLDTVRIYARLAEVDLEKSQRKASPADNWRL